MSILVFLYCNILLYLISNYNCLNNIILPSFEENHFYIVIIESDFECLDNLNSTNYQINSVSACLHSINM